MKVLLTGANGFVGSHILDELIAAAIPTAILLRSSSTTEFIAHHRTGVEIRRGSVLEPSSLVLEGITHVIHCAGLVKAVRPQEFYDVNRDGTRNVAEAANRTPGIQRLVHISSLAAAGPAMPDQPARETDRPKPVSEYGASKLAGEKEVETRCKSPFTILRPPAIYGPRDAGFFRLFEAVQRHLLPRPTKQPLSLVFVSDFAKAATACLTNPGAAGKTYFVASREVVTARSMADEIAAQMKRWTIPIPLPVAMFWPLCLAHELMSRVTGKANILSLKKFAELKAPGWVCSPSKLEAETGISCPTLLRPGIARTLAWYREHGWL